MLNNEDLVLFYPALLFLLQTFFLTAIQSLVCSAECTMVVSESSRITSLRRPMIIALNTPSPCPIVFRFLAIRKTRPEFQPSLRLLSSEYANCRVSEDIFKMKLYCSRFN